MAKFRDKLEKIKVQKFDPVVVIQKTGYKSQFCCFIDDNFDYYVHKRIFSLKRLARIFLKENPFIYFEYEALVHKEEENIKIAQDKSCWEFDD